MKILFTSTALALFSLASIAQQTPQAKPASPAQMATPETANTPAPPAHPITTEQSKELFELAGTKGMMEQMIRRSLAMQRASAPPYIPAEVWTDLQDSFLKVDFAQLMAPTYQKYLSEEDAKQILAFYRTPAGQRLLAAMPQVLMESGEVGRKEGQRIATEVLQRHQQQIIDAQKKYEQQAKPGEGPQSAPPANVHPDSASPHN